MSESQAPRTPARLWIGPPLPEVEKPGSAALCVARASSAISQTTAPIRRTACSRQCGAWPADGSREGSSAPSPRSEPNGKVIRELSSLALPRNSGPTGPVPSRRAGGKRSREGATLSRPAGGLQPVSGAVDGPSACQLLLDDDPAVLLRLHHAAPFEVFHHAADHFARRADDLGQVLARDLVADDLDLAVHLGHVEQGAGDAAVD